VTVIDDAHEDTLKAAEVLIQSLRNTNTNLPIIAIVNGGPPPNKKKFYADPYEDLPDYARKRLIRAGYILHDVQPIHHPLKECRHDEGSVTLTKLRVWQLNCLDRVVYLDVESVVVSNIDSLFRDASFKILPAKTLTTSHGTVTPLLVLQPDPDLFTDMLKWLPAVHLRSCGDEAFLSLFYDFYDVPDAMRLPEEYSCPHDVFNELPALRRKQIKVVTFGFGGTGQGARPWMYAARDATNQLAVPNVASHLWKGIYRSVIASHTAAFSAGNSSSLRLRSNFVRRTQEWIDSVVLPLVPKDAAVALIDFPHNRNTGEMATWLGERRFFERHNIPIAFECTAFLNNTLRYKTHDCDFAAMRKALGDRGTIFIHGGSHFGNFANRPELEYHTVFRYQVLQEFRKNKIVFLPQTLRFQDTFPHLLSQARQNLIKHNDVTLLWRDEPSARVGKRLFKPHHSYLCPDMAFLLNDEVAALSVKPKHMISWLGRTDGARVKRREVQPMAGVVRRDWNIAPRSAGHVERGLEMVGQGVQFVSSGEVVVTDRLHGIIIAYLAGRPIVAMHDKHGLVWKYVRTFLTDDRHIHWAKDEVEALHIAWMIGHERTSPSKLQVPRGTNLNLMILEEAEAEIFKEVERNSNSKQQDQLQKTSHPLTPNLSSQRATL